MYKILKKMFCFITIFVIIVYIDSVYAKNYYVSDNEIVDNELEVPCWVGWKEWHFGATNPISKKGDLVIFKTPMIKNGVPTYFESEVITNGYGHYGLDFSKHVLGLLYYMKDKVSDYQTNYIPIYDEPEVDEHGNLISPSPVKMRKALEITVNKLIQTWHSANYEVNEFKHFWENSFTAEHIYELRRLQNNFYWKAYGEEAYNLLKNMMNAYGDNYFSRLSLNQKIALKGIVLSIMEARYRNKDVQRKTDLKIKAAEGELCPFLVTLKNLDKINRSGSSDNYTYIDSERQSIYYEFPPFDELIDGVYHYMIYYDKDTLNSTTHSTLTSKALEGIEEDINADFESEYYSLTGFPINALTGKKLEKFYSDCSLARSIFKKSKENTEGIFGAEEVYDITSDINLSDAITNMKTAMQDFANAVGGDVKKIFNGLDSEHIARTYTMAKNIVSTYRIKDEYAYYDIGTNIINYTPGLNGDEYMLIDFQKVKLKSPLEIYNNGRIKTYEDSDNDGIYDRNELGDASSESLNENTMKKKVDVTGFVKKMIERELYGNDEKLIKENQNYIKEVLAKVKYNIYNQRNNFDAENSDNNKQNWKEVYENNLNVDDETKSALGVLIGDSAKIQYIKLSPSKLNVELWKYKSNPVLKDTDFDGIDDGLGRIKLIEKERQYGLTEENEDDERTRMQYCKYITYDMMKNDMNPKDNHFTGRMNTSRISGNNAIEVDMNMDYRYFFLSNKQYYDELSTMSLLYSNSIYRQGDGQSMHSGLVIKDIQNKGSGECETMSLNGIDYKNLKVKDMMEFFGFKNVKTYYMGEEMDKTASGYSINDDPADGADYCRNYKDTHKGKVALGYKTIEYHGLYKNVIGIVIRGTAEDDDWDSDFDMGDKELRDKLDYSGGKQNYIDNYDDILSVLNNGILDYDKQYSQELLHFAGGYPDWKWDYHHAGFDIVANRILEIVKEYYEEVKDHFDDDIEILDENTIENPVTANSVRKNDGGNIIDGGVCYWVTGHSMGAGVANLVAASLISSEAIPDISDIGGNSDNVYCYTFAAPNTFYKTDNRYIRNSLAIPGKNVTGDYREPKGVKYRCIFNIVNDDDFVPKLPMEECEWTKYGRTATASYNIIKGFKTISRTMDERLTANERFDYVEYNGNSDICNDVIGAFTKVYESNKKNMRSDTYKIEDLIKSKFASSSGYQYRNKYTKPFQKTKSLGSSNTIEYVFEQKQSPAYFLNILSGSMHSRNNTGVTVTLGNITGLINKANLIFYELHKRYNAARIELIKNRDLLETPHYLESYYNLTKRISSIDFK